MPEEIPEDWYSHTSENTDDNNEEEDTAQSDQVVKYERIDVYWSKVGKMTRPTGKKKVPSSHETGKNCSHLNNGNADVERGFSKNKLLLTSHRMRLEMPAINIQVSE